MNQETFVSKNLDFLESIIQTEIRKKYDSDRVIATEYELQNTADQIRDMLSPTFPVSDEEYSILLRKLKAAFMVRMEPGIALIGNKQKHIHWLQKKWDSINFYNWKSYERYLLEAKNWNHPIVKAMDEVSSDILDLLEDPTSNDRPHVRGLVIGDIQSGKTANYTAICNKAADLGYDVIIVMTGILENLRIQTQERLDLEFIGRESKYILRKKNTGQEIQPVTSNIGVGKYRPSDCEKERTIQCYTSTEQDFNKKKMDNNVIMVKGSTSLFVVKKNTSTLSNLLEWLKSKHTNPATGKIHFSLLMIDDEADNASIHTGSDENDPTRINGLIRKILGEFNRTSYLGITATPFANIFINPDTNSEMLGDDLFPRDFIYALSPPSNYIGPNKLFGEPEFLNEYDEALKYYGDSVISVSSYEMEQYIPLKHKSGYNVSELPPSLLKALRYFLLVNAIRDIRGDTKTHRSMMVNVSRFTAVQNQIASLIEKWYKDTRAEIRGYSKLSAEEALLRPEIQALKDIWDDYNLEELAECSWEKMQKTYLSSAIADIRVQPVNKDTGAKSLNYNDYKKDGLRVVVVGGNSLSRGLTIEGLCVSFFYRNTQMYDTLLQMGRWFGYRPNYDDLFKVWMSEENRDSYGSVTSAIKDFLKDISIMKKRGKTPDDFGLKVRQEPETLLLVTARNKMRTGTIFTRPISVSGRLLETPRLPFDLEKLASNERLSRDFITHIGEYGGVYDESERAHGALLWTNVSKNKVSEFVKSFDSHPWNMAFQSLALAEYIKDEMSDETWDVAIPQGEGETIIHVPIGERTIDRKAEGRAILIVDDMIKISRTKGRVSSGTAAKIGLTNDQINDAQKIFENKTYTDQTYLQVPGRKPLLMIHPIECKPDVSTPGYDRKIVWAIGLGFPGDKDDTKTATYVVNIREYQALIDMINEDGDLSDDSIY
ncbi:MAG: Z1 domain-containing protein [Bacilli bacterium]|nr:Z1 domain-containing protein [Bacilli bacterium]